MKRIMLRKRGEKSDVKKRRSRTRNFALESQLWRAEIDRLCREFDQDFEKRKMTQNGRRNDAKWRTVQRTNTFRIQKCITQV